MVLTDDDVCPMGKHGKAGTLMRDVPTSYLEWLDKECIIPRSGKTFAVIDYYQTYRKEKIMPEIDDVSPEDLESWFEVEQEEQEENDESWGEGEGPQDKWHGEEA